MASKPTVLSPMKALFMELPCQLIIVVCPPRPRKPADGIKANETEADGVPLDERAGNGIFIRLFRTDNRGKYFSVPYFPPSSEIWRSKLMKSKPTASSLKNVLCVKFP